MRVEKPQVGRAILAGMVAFVIFVVVGFAYAYSIAGAVMAKASDLDIPTTGSPFLLALVEFYLLINGACFTSIANVFQATVAMLKGFAGTFGAVGALNASMSTMMLGVIELLEMMIPNTLIFYGAGILSGLVSAFLFFRNDDNIANAATLALIPAIVTTVAIFAVNSYIVGATMQEMATSTPQLGQMLAIAFPVSDYLMIFAITWVITAVGAAIPALIFEFKK